MKYPSHQTIKNWIEYHISDTILRNQSWHPEVGLEVVASSHCKGQNFQLDTASWVMGHAEEGKIARYILIYFQSFWRFSLRNLVLYILHFVSSCRPLLKFQWVAVIYAEWLDQCFRILGCSILKGVMLL